MFSQDCHKTFCIMDDLAAFLCLRIIYGKYGIIPYQTISHVYRYPLGLWWQPKPFKIPVGHPMKGSTQSGILVFVLQR